MFSDLFISRRTYFMTHYKDMPFLVVDETIAEGKMPLNELFKMSTVAKVFLAGLAAWVVGKASRMKVRGSRHEIDATARALRSSRRFQDEIRRPGASVQGVMEKLRLKNASASDFERILGVPFPL